MPIHEEREDQKEMLGEIVAKFIERLIPDRYSTILVTIKDGCLANVEVRDTFNTIEQLRN